MSLEKIHGITFNTVTLWSKRNKMKLHQISFWKSTKYLSDLLYLPYIRRTERNQWIRICLNYESCKTTAELENYNQLFRTALWARSSHAKTAQGKIVYNTCLLSPLPYSPQASTTVTNGIPGFCRLQCLPRMTFSKEFWLWIRQWVWLLKSMWILSLTEEELGFHPKNATTCYLTLSVT